VLEDIFEYRVCEGSSGAPRMDTIMEIITARLHIRDLIETDAEPLHRLRTDPLVYRFNHFGPETMQQTQTWVVRTMAYNQRQRRDSHNCAIVLHASGRVIGWIGFGFSHPEEKPIGDVGIGYAILPKDWSQGYATEALRATLDYIFCNTAAENALAHCNVGNHISARVMEKAGMTFIARRPNPHETAPEKAESFHYQLSRTDWKKGR
jgi:[ribosomal protein S5]-alanine N-acetyltransferase